MKHIFSIAILFIFGYACNTKQNTKTANENSSNEYSVTLTSEQIKNANIETGKLQVQTLSSILKVNGRVDVPPQNMVSVSLPLGGYLKQTHLMPGMQVKRGEVIAVIEDQQYIQLQQDYLTAKAKINYYENEYKRQKELNLSQSSSDKVYQQAEAEYRTQRVLLTSLLEKLKLAGVNIQSISETNITRSVNVLSPITGFVSKVNVNIGKYVSPTDIMFELINPADIHLALKVFEKDLPKIFIGQRLVAYTTHEPTKQYGGQIILTGKDITAESTTDVHCHFDATDKPLVPGTYMTAEIAVQTKDATVIPTDAIVRFQGKHFVYVKTGPNQFDMKEIQIGETENGFSEIVQADLQNLSQLELVTKGAYSILMQMKNKAE